jgi:hypothetical protein
MKGLTILAAAIGAGLALGGPTAAQTAPPTNPPSAARPAFVDANGDGICDNCNGTPQRKGRGVRRGQGGSGPRDGSGSQGVGPRDGSGYGRRSGAGSCNGTGPRGRGRSGR